MDPNKPGFGYHFAKLHRLFLSLSKDPIRSLGILPNQMPFLAVLLGHDAPITQEALTNKLIINKATTARVVEQLEKKGFVFRITNPHNRRQKLVSATQKAHRIADRLFAILQSISNVFVCDFTQEEQATVLDLMDRMIVNTTQGKHERSDCPYSDDPVLGNGPAH
jgi:DNA-binding MarR family transcriptional regulator